MSRGAEECAFGTAPQLEFPFSHPCSFPPLPIPPGQSPLHHTPPTTAVHYLSFNCFAFGLPLNITQTAWIEADLAAVDHGRTPWIVATQHAPWYNTNSAHQDNGLPALMAYESMFIKYGVSAVFSGHVHAYERSTPVANFKVMPPGPGSMVHLNIGDGGAGLYTTWLAEQPWSAYRNATWGHGRFSVLNLTHAAWTWHDNEVDDSVVLDSAVILNANPAVWA